VRCLHYDASTIHVAAVESSNSILRIPVVVEFNKGVALFEVHA